MAFIPGLDAGQGELVVKGNKEESVGSTEQELGQDALLAMDDPWSWAFPKWHDKDVSHGLQWKNQ